MKRWGTDYIVGAYTFGTPQTLLVKELARINHPAILLHHASLASAYLDTRDPAFEGHMCYQYTVGWNDKDIAEVALMRKMNNKWHGKVPDHNDYYVVGWHAGMIFSEALRMVIEKHGADNLTGPNIREALESMKNMNMNGISAPTNYNKWDHQGNRGIRWVKLEKGKLIPVSEFMEAPPLTDETRNPAFWK
jgi:hypothetical protein